MRLRSKPTRRRHQLHLTHQAISLSRLPADFAGLRVVQLTDIHHGLYMPLEQVERAVDLANSLEPDLVVLTGDFVTNSPNYVSPVAAALGNSARAGELCRARQSRLPRGADGVTAALERNGIEVLRNRHVRLGSNGSTVVLAGVDDLGYGQADVRAALRGASDVPCVVLLSHNPAVLPWAALHGVDLVLSGHTHGGQMDLPRVRRFIHRRGLRVPIRFRHGWDQVGDTQIYISRGIGTVVVPLRLRCPAEIPVLRLEAANGHATALPAGGE
jgi:predicted MPP superfamily phosphohydrolase